MMKHRMGSSNCGLPDPYLTPDPFIPFKQEKCSLNSLFYRAFDLTLGATEKFSVGLARQVPLPDPNLSPAPRPPPPRPLPNN